MKKIFSLCLFLILIFSSYTISAQACDSSCFSKPKNISLNYTLRGEEGKINFSVYHGMKIYFSELPRGFYYFNDSRLNVKMQILNDEKQKEMLLPLVDAIKNITDDKTDRLRIAVSIVQKIPFGGSERIVQTEGGMVVYPRYPYEVLYDGKGVCSEKADLLVFLLRELGYKVGYFYYDEENHESVAVRCPFWNSLSWSGYCFVEPIGVAIISDSDLEYSNIGRLYSKPEFVFISKGEKLGIGLYEYKDARVFRKIRNALARGELSSSKTEKFEELREKYGLNGVYNV